jgi:pimeloyl-ACP methyl ester carboxylesterase
MRPEDLQVEHRTAHVNGVRLQYVEKSPSNGGRAPLVLLLHGFPETWWSWRRQIDPLVAAGFRVVVPDQRGYADSDKRGPFDVDTLAADMCALIDHVAPQEKKAIVVGHDWGGGVAWHLAATRPEHCTRLVVMNCPHPAMMLRALRSKWSQIKKSWYIFFFQIPFLPERFLLRDVERRLPKMFRAMAVDRTNFSDEEVAPIVEAVKKPGAAKGMIGWYRAAIRRGLLQPKVANAMPKIDAPTLLLWATEDKALGYDDLVPGTERYVPGLRIEKIPQCGHFVQQEKPEAVNARLIAFLREGASTGTHAARA